MIVNVMLRGYNPMNSVHSLGRVREIDFRDSRNLRNGKLRTTMTTRNDLQLTLDFDQEPGSESSLQYAGRIENRDAMIRLAEYSPFPWTNADQRRNEAVTINISQTGICLRVDTPIEPDSMLRVIVRDLDGKPYRDALARVAWCRKEQSGSSILGLTLVAEMGCNPVRVRHPGKARWAEVA